MAKANKAISLGVVSLVAIILIAVFLFVPISQSYSVPNQYGPAGLNTTIHTSLSCQTIGLGEVSIHGVALLWTGNEWSNNCKVPSHVFIPNPNHINATSLASSSTNAGTTTTSASVVCTISAEPTGFYLRVIGANSSSPIGDAKLTTTVVSECDNVNSTLTNWQGFFTTNSSGWISVLIASVPSGNYFLVFNVQYSNSTFQFSKTFNVYWQPEQGTFVTLSIPSGSVTVVYRVPVGCNVTCTYAKG
ncbi:MAG: hypothetical protein ACYCPW_03735 [Nitrososphaerales archaeon]